MTDLTDEIKEANNKLKKEIEQWDALQVLPHTVIEINVLMLDTFTNSLAAFLVEKGIIEDQEMTLFFKGRMLKRLQEMREEVTPHIQKARREAMGIETAMTIPSGLKLN